MTWQDLNQIQYRYWFFEADSNIDIWPIVTFYMNTMIPWFYLKGLWHLLKICMKENILQLKNQLVSSLWWTHYVKKTLFLNDIYLWHFYIGISCTFYFSYSSANIKCNTATRWFQLIGLAVSWSVIQYIKVNVKVGFTSFPCGFCSSSAKWQR